MNTNWMEGHSCPAESDTSPIDVVNQSLRVLLLLELTYRIKNHHQTAL